VPCWHRNYLASTAHGFSRPRCKQWKYDAWKYRYVIYLLVETSLIEELDSPEDELSKLIIIDNNRGEPIIIDTSDKEVANNKPCLNPQRRAQRKQVLTQSLEIVNWTSKEYETRIAASLSAAWKEVWKQ
jgi:hypothetical protein